MDKNSLTKELIVLQSPDHNGDTRSYFSPLRPEVWALEPPCNPQVMNHSFISARTHKTIEWTQTENELEFTFVSILNSIVNPGDTVLPVGILFKG